MAQYSRRVQPPTRADQEEALGISALKAAIANAVAEISPDDMDLYEIEADTLILEAIEGRTVAAVIEPAPVFLRNPPAVPR